MSAVRYSPLSRQTTKDIMKAGLIDEAFLYQVGAFVAKIQALGIYFRGHHIGNMVLTPNGDLGLIDVSEFSIYWHLSRYRRLRNFARFCRHKNDNDYFGKANISELISGYLSINKTCFIKARNISKLLN
jgi:hypothetical protein